MKKHIFNFAKSRVSWRIRLSFFLYLCAFIHSNQGVANKDKKTLTIGGLYASGEMTTFQNASGIIKTVNHALQFINDRSKILPGYNLEIQWRDTKCQLGYGVQALFQHVNEPPTKIMLLGGMCSAATLPIAECSHLMNLIQVSYGASSFYLSDKQKYPLFFRTIPPEKGQNRGRLAVLKHFKWNRIAIVTEKESYYEAAYTSLKTLLEKNNISLVAQESLGDSEEEDHQSTIKTLKDRHARVIVGLFSEEKAVEVFCQAYKQGFYGGKYVWLLIGWYQRHWWKIHSTRASKLNCEIKHLIEAFGHYISTAFLKIGLSSPHIIEGEEAYRSWKNNVDELGFYSGFAHDAVVAMAFALNNSAQILATKNKTLDDFTYKDSEMVQVFKESLSKVKFLGFSVMSCSRGNLSFMNCAYIARKSENKIKKHFFRGPVYFNDEGERKGIVTVSQMQDGELRKLGNYTVDEDKLVLESSKFVWKSGKIPADHMTTVNKLQKISKGFFGFFCSVEILGIITAVAFLAFNISHSTHRFIKMSSPRMNNIIVIGAILIYTAGILLGIDGNFVSPSAEAIVRCRLSTWVACFGFTLGFGGMFLKTWRVHKIFLNRTKKMVISDFQLFAMLGLFISIDFLIIMVWEIIDSMHADKYFTGREEYSPSTDTKYVTYYINCTSSYPNLWLGIIYAYKGLLLAFGAFLAWETKSVTVAALNDSRHIGISVYNVVFPCALGMTVINLVDNDPDVCYAVLSVLVVFCTTITLCFVFIPKIMTVRADPLGTNRAHFVSGLNNTPAQQTRPEERQQLQLQPQPKIKPKSGSSQKDRNRANSSLL